MVKKKENISTSSRFCPDDIEFMRESIEEAGGCEVLTAATVLEKDQWGSVRVLARGNEVSAPAVLNGLTSGDILIHNHPSGLLRPSDADMGIASLCGKSGLGFCIINNDCTEIYTVVEPFTAKAKVLLDPDEMTAFISSGGEAADALTSFEERPGQKEMMRKIVEAMNEGTHAVLEGETGIGKSMAYLIPALHFAVKNKCRIAVSTNTINLQHQLVSRDLPFLKKHLPFKFEYRLLKGRQNYLCMRRMSEAAGSDDRDFLLETSELSQFEALKDWAQATEDGSLSDLNWVPLDSLWDKLCCDKDSCTGIKCPHYDECFFYRARRDATDAHLLVVNHHLLFSDLALRADTDEYNQTAVIPACKVFILDEAHNLEDTATKHFGFRTAHMGILRTLNKIFMRKGRQERGSIAALYRLISFGNGTEDEKERSEILLEISEKVIPLRLDCEAFNKELFDGIIEMIVPPGKPKLGEYRLRVGQRESASQQFTNISNSAFKLRDSLKSLSGRMKKVARRISNALNDNYDADSQFDVPLTETSKFAVRLEEAARAINVLFESSFDNNDSFVHFFTANVRKTGIYASFSSMPIEVSQPMVDYCFSKIPSAVLVSGTLSTAGNFNFIKHRLGLDSEELSAPPVEGRFTSPFNYKEQARIMIPSDMPDPSGSAFGELLAKPVLDIIMSSGGGALVLCTSYMHLNQLYNSLCNELAERNIECYKQGDLERHYLIELFKEDGNAVLFATDSFWEGVDIPGDALRNLIIVKLPFASPSDPVLEARNERLKSEGKNAFRDYQLPMAALKLKQGVGRLIRSKTDKGVIWLLDKRLVTKSYGSYFLENLPPAPVLKGKTSALVKMSAKFFKDNGSDTDRDEFFN